MARFLWQKSFSIKAAPASRQLEWHVQRAVENSGHLPDSAACCRWFAAFRPINFWSLCCLVAEHRMPPHYRARSIWVAAWKETIWTSWDPLLFCGTICRWGWVIGSFIHTSSSIPTTLFFCSLGFLLCEQFPDSFFFLQEVILGRCIDQRSPSSIKVKSTSYSIILRRTFEHLPPVCTLQALVAKACNKDSWIVSVLLHWMMCIILFQTVIYCLILVPSQLLGEQTVLTDVKSHETQAKAFGRASIGS